DLIAKGQYRLFYFRISEIVRGYVGARFAFDSLELTTTELVERLKTLCTTGLDLDGFAGFCADTDLVKFAKHAPSGAEVSRAVDAAYGFIRKTSVEQSADGGAAHGN
ncbi:MAG: hypothetical protein WC889_13960, partial [Myxococcota bacterium]